MQKKSNQNSYTGSNTYTIDLEENEKLEYAKEQVTHKRGLNPNVKKLVIQNKSILWDDDELFDLFDPGKKDLTVNNKEKLNNDELIQHLLESQKKHRQEIDDLKKIVKELTKKMNEEKKII